MYGVSQRHEPALEEVQTIYDSLTKKTPTMQNKLESVQSQWQGLWKTSGLYIERLKCVELALSGLDEATTLVSELDMKLGDYRRLPDDREGLRSVHLSLVDIKNGLHKHQVSSDALLISAPASPLFSVSLDCIFCFVECAIPVLFPFMLHACRF